MNEGDEQGVKTFVTQPAICLKREGDFVDKQF